jgi:NAD(P)-dependent dehydrogenase (short-subunit alcohol dehydrogenase family)
MTAGERNQNMAQELTVVVTGSTGNQGGAVARGLLERGHKVRAVTREPNSSRAKSLANPGATLVAASLEDTGSTRTSPAPGTGRGTSRTSRTSMPPYESNCTALVMKH